MNEFNLSTTENFIKEINEKIEKQILRAIEEGEKYVDVVYETDNYNRPHPKYWIAFEIYVTSKEEPDYHGKYRYERYYVEKGVDEGLI